MSATAHPAPNDRGLWTTAARFATCRACCWTSRLIAHLSHCMRLLPGDLIFTGTPPGVGVGVGRTPRRFLRPGMVMEAEVEGLGRQQMAVTEAPPQGLDATAARA